MLKLFCVFLFIFPNAKALSKDDCLKVFDLLRSGYLSSSYEVRIFINAPDEARIPLKVNQNRNSFDPLFYFDSEIIKRVFPKWIKPLKGSSLSEFQKTREVLKLKAFCDALVSVFLEKRAIFLSPSTLKSVKRGGLGFEYTDSFFELDYCVYAVFMKFICSFLDRSFSNYVIPQGQLFDDQEIDECPDLTKSNFYKNHFNFFRKKLEQHHFDVIRLMVDELGGSEEKNLMLDLLGNVDDNFVHAQAQEKYGSLINRFSTLNPDFQKSFSNISSVYKYRAGLARAEDLVEEGWRCDLEFFRMASWFNVLSVMYVNESFCDQDLVAWLAVGLLVLKSAIDQSSFAKLDLAEDLGKSVSEVAQNVFSLTSLSCYLKHLIAVESKNSTEKAAVFDEAIIFYSFVPDSFPKVRRRKSLKELVDGMIPFAESNHRFFSKK